MACATFSTFPDFLKLPLKETGGCVPVLGRPEYCCPQGAITISTTEGPRDRQGNLERPVLWGHWALGSPAMVMADSWQRSSGLRGRPEVRERERREETALPRAPSGTSRGL